MDQDQVQGKQAREQNVISRLDNYFTPKAPEKAVTEKQPEPTPSSDQKPTEVSSSETEPKQVAPVEAQVDEERIALENSKNPERTKAYIEKLKKELADSRAPKSEPPQEYEGDSVLDVMSPKVPTQREVPYVQPPVNLNQFPGLNPLQVQNLTQQFVDKDGNVDINGLNNALYQSNQRALQASEAARQANERVSRFEETQQVRELHSQFPELDPKNKTGFDKQFFEQVKDRIVRNMWESKKQSPVEVAREIKSFFKPEVSRNKIETEAVDNYKKVQQARIQGPIEQGKGESRQSDTSYEELRKQTRQHGLDNPALDQRLNNYFKKP